MFNLEDIPGNKTASSYFDYVLYLNIRRYTDAMWNHDIRQIKSAIDAVEDIMSKNIQNMEFKYEGKFGAYAKHKRELIEKYATRKRELEHKGADESELDDAELAHLRSRFQVLMCLIGDTEHHPRNEVEDYQP